MIEPITIHVEGVAKPAGSKRSFAIKKGGVYTGKTATVDANPNSRDWKHDVKCAALDVYDGDPLTCPLRIEIIFTMPRPKSHFRTGKNASALKLEAPDLHKSRPDATKLLRGVEDALTGVIWKDDAQISTQTVKKRYGIRAGAQITIREDAV